MDFLMGKPFQENISQKMNEFVEKLQPVVVILPELSRTLYGLCLQRAWLAFPYLFRVHIYSEVAWTLLQYDEIDEVIL